MSFHIITLTAVLFGIAVPSFRGKISQAVVAFPLSKGHKSFHDPDPRIKKALESLGLNYKITDSGDFRVSFNIEGEGRMQYVFIDSKTYNLGEMELRRIWSPVAIFKKPPPAKVMTRLLEKSSNNKLGGYQIVSDDDGTSYVTFFAQIDADLSPDLLIIYLKAVALPADESEKEITDSDTF